MAPPRLLAKDVKPLRLPLDLTKRIDALAKTHGVTQTEMVFHMIDAFETAYAEKKVDETIEDVGNP